LMSFESGRQALSNHPFIFQFFFICCPSLI